jgi:hypothetical protein
MQREDPKHLPSALSRSLSRCVAKLRANIGVCTRLQEDFCHQNIIAHYRNVKRRLTHIAYRVDGSPGHDLATP